MPSYRLPDSRPRALILTIGVGADPRIDVVPALQTEIRALAPEELVIVCSPQSRKNAERAAEAMERGAPHVSIVELESPHDLDAAFKAVNGAIEALAEKDIAPEETAINYTSGTKVMSSGGVLSAVFNRCGELRYLTGRQDAQGAGRAIKTHPAAVFAHQDLARARHDALELRLDSAQEILREIDDCLLAEKLRAVRSQLLLLAEAYSAREAFQYRRFLEIYLKVQFQSPLTEPFRMSTAGEKAAAELAAEIEAGAPGRVALVELYNNGLRRIEVGSPDDAFTRLYRAMEVMGQWVLRRDFDIHTEDVDTRKIPPRNRANYEALRSLVDGTVKIGLRKAFELLYFLDAPTGVHFHDAAAMRHVQAMRQRSILSHGLSPITEEEARDAFAAARELFLIEVRDMDAVAATLQFPWLNVKVAPASVAPASARA